MEFDRRAFIASVGGASVIAGMSVEAQADTLEEYLQDGLNQAVADGDAPRKKFPTVAELAAQADTRPVRLGGGRLFSSLLAINYVDRLGHLGGTLVFDPTGKP